MFQLLQKIKIHPCLAARTRAVSVAAAAAVKVLAEADPTNFAAMAALSVAAVVGPESTAGVAPYPEPPCPVLEGHEQCTQARRVQRRKKSLIDLVMRRDDHPLGGGCGSA